MDVRTAQRLFLAAGYYNGGIDGDAGPKTERAVDTLLAKHAKLMTPEAYRWSNARRLVAAVQIVLHFAGYEPGVIDGLDGHNTQNALRAYEFKQITGQPEVIDRTPVLTPRVPKIFPLQKDCTAFYGAPASKALEAQLVYITPPYKMRIDYDLDAPVSRIRVHKKCADSALGALTAIKDHYGESRLRELGLDRFAGSYAPRKMRGGTSWSMHAYGCAFDWYAAPNGLTTTCPKALFCGKEYSAFFDIWAANGWVSLGRAIGRDWMHVQAARLS